MRKKFIACLIVNGLLTFAVYHLSGPGPWFWFYVVLLALSTVCLILLIWIETRHPDVPLEHDLKDLRVDEDRHLYSKDKRIF